MRLKRRARGSLRRGPSRAERRVSIQQKAGSELLHVGDGMRWEDMELGGKGLFGWLPGGMGGLLDLLILPSAGPGPVLVFFARMVVDEN